MAIARLSWNAAVVCALTCGLTLSSRADELRTGDHIRYSLAERPEHQREGTVVEVGDTSLVVKTHGEGAQTLPLTSLTNLEAARVTYSGTRTGAIIGFIPGALIGGVAGAAAECSDRGSDCSGLGTGVSAALLVGGLTAAVGAVVGTLFHHTQWEPVSSPRVGLSVAPPARGHGASARIAVRF